MLVVGAPRLYFLHQGLQFFAIKISVAVPQPASQAGNAHFVLVQRVCDDRLTLFIGKNAGVRSSRRYVLRLVLLEFWFADL